MDFDGSVATANSFGYNARSEVKGALMGENVYSFTYDYNLIGNRYRLGCASNMYDHQSRRIRKEVSAYNASTGNFESVTCPCVII